jgi:hypothetical protein
MSSILPVTNSFIVITSVNYFVNFVLGIVKHFTPTTVPGSELGYSNLLPPLSIKITSPVLGKNRLF